MRFRFFQIEVTRKCNLDCLICPSRLFPKKEDMSFETFLKISEYFDKTDMIHLQGWGESFLHPEIIEMIRIAKEHAKTGLTTNGSLLKKFCEEIVELQLDYIAVSISGPETQGKIRKGSSFENLIKSIEFLNEMKKRFKSNLPIINLTFLMTTMNLDEIPLAFKLASKLNTGLILTNLDYTFDETTYNLRVFDSKISKKAEKIIGKIEKDARNLGIPFKRPSLKSVERAVCDAFPESAIVFSVEGDVFPCVYLNLPFRRIPRYFKGKKIFVERPEFGNVMEKTLEEIWNSKVYSQFRERFERRIEATRSLKYILGFGDKDFLKFSPPECCRGCYKLYGI